MAGSNFADEVRSVLADTMNLPQEFLNYQIQYQALNALETPRTSGMRLAHGTNTSSVTTTGTTFGTGADLLSTPLEFTATGNNDYIVRVSATDWQNNTAGDLCFLGLNLDGADAGYLCLMTCPGANYIVPCSGAIKITPATGSHSVNVRLTVSAGTGTVEAGAGGAGTRGPIIVTIEVA